MQNEKGGPATSRTEKLTVNSISTLPYKASRRRAVRFGPRFLDLERTANYLRALAATCTDAADSRQPDEILAAISILRTLRLSAPEVRS